jgi:hypothetical protein
VPEITFRAVGFFGGPGMQTPQNRFFYPARAKKRLHGRFPASAGNPFHPP